MNMKVHLIAALAVTMMGGAYAQTFTNYTSADGLLADNVNAVDTDARQHNLVRDTEWCF